MKNKLSQNIDTLIDETAVPRLLDKGLLLKSTPSFGELIASTLKRKRTPLNPMTGKPFIKKSQYTSIYT